MEENPAYQTAEPPQYELVVGATSSYVQMEENPAYQSVYRHNCIPAEGSLLICCYVNAVHRDVKPSV